ncbi:MAG: IPT/TIG domain-containing protein [Myxococcaceae bacterium]|nr:IPT/TIG domain-containing protein [Myxococcaceae bacterium]
MSSLNRLGLVAVAVSCALVTACGDKSPKVTAGTEVPVIGQVLPGRGPVEGGTVAVIRGLNFRPGLSVTFGTSAATFVRVVDATTVTVVTPAGAAGRVNVVVSSAEGQTTTFRDGFEYYVKDGTTAPAPTLSAIAPNTGPASGGTVALVTGTGLQSGAILLIGRAPASDVVVVDATSLSGMLPANPVGTSDVEVTNPDGQSAVLPGAFAYSDAEGVGPVISAISPIAGSTTGGTLVTVGGSNFRSGALVFFGGKLATASNTTPVAVSVASPPSVPGVVDVAITNPDGRSAIARGAYNYYVGGPVIARITPAFGPLDGGTDVVLDGRNFQQRITGTVGGRALQNVRRIDDRSITASTPRGAMSGAVDVRVENDDGQSDTLLNGFAYGNAPPPSFALSRVTPEVGPIAGGTRVTIIGSGFATGATVTFGGQPATGVQVVGGATISCVTPAGMIGPVEVVVTQNADSRRLQLGFWYFDPSRRGPTPSIAAVSPALGPVAGGSTVLLTGNGFADGARVYFGTKAASTTTFVTASTLTAVTPPGDTTGPVDVRVQNPDGQVVTLNQGYVYVDGSTLGPAPALTSVTPNTGGSADETAVVIAAQNVTAGALVFAGGRPAKNVMLRTGSVDATFGPDDPGAVDVAITNPDGQSGRLANGFTYSRSPPTLATITPNTVPVGGGLKVLLSGRGFVAGAAVTIGTQMVATTFVDSTLLFVTVPPNPLGQVDVTVTNPDGQRSTLMNGLTYANIMLGNSPTVTSIAPARGPTTGGTVALLVGTHFSQGARVLFGANAATNVVVMSDTRLSCRAPAGMSGLTDLTVVNPDGQSAQLLQAFRYVDPSTLGPGPTLASVTPSSGNSTGGTQTVLTGSLFQQGMLVFFGGFSASASNVQNGGIATATTPGGPTGLVDVAVTNPDGQSSVLVNAFNYTPRPEPQTIFPAEGPTGGGTMFTIAGRNFSAGAKVFFGATEATTAMVQSPTVITGTTPARAAGVVDVRVQNPDGQSGTLTMAFTYNSAPTIALARPGAGPVAGGTTVLITGTGFRQGTTVQVAGGMATAVRVVSDTQLYAVTPSGSPGAADVIVTNPDMQAATLTRGFRYDFPDSQAQASSMQPAVYVPMARDDAAYKTDLGVINLSGAAVTVTVASVDGAGVQQGSRALTAQVPAFGRTLVPDVLRFVEGATAQLNKTTSLVVTSDGPVTAFTVVTDRASNDASVIQGATTARAASRVIVPYTSSVGAFRTWLTVRNVGSTAAAIDITARDAAGMQLGRLSAVNVAANGLYSSDDVLGAMNVMGGVASLDVSGPMGANLIAAARVYSNVRLGGAIGGRPFSDAATSQVLPYLPDTTSETSTFSLVNTEAIAGSASLELRSATGQVLGTQNVMVPANGFVVVADLARTLLSRTVPTQTQSSLHVTTTTRMLTSALVLTTATGDLRLMNGRPGGGVRLLIPFADGRTSLAVVNTGVAAANLEVQLYVDSGSTRGTPLRIAVPPRGSFQAALLLSSLGAGASNGYVEVRSLNGMPLVAAAKVGNDPAGERGDLIDLAQVITTPTVQQLRPATGPAPGGTMSRITGAYFLPGIQFLYGDKPAPRAQAFAFDTAVAVSPGGMNGEVVDVTAINLDGASGSLPLSFSYVDPAMLGAPPAVASVAPQSLSVLGGTAMQVNGSNFANQALAFVGLSPVAGAVQVNPNRVDGTAPPGPIGPADVTVTNPDGQSATLTGGVTYVVPPPSISTLTPNTGPGAGGTTVRITGNGFQVGASVGFGASSSPVATVLNATEIDAVTPAGADGPVNLTIVNPDGQSTTLNNGFTFVAPPTVAQVQPTSGSTAGGTLITITGTFLRQGATVQVGSTACANVNVAMGGTTITCQTPAGTAGPVAIRVTNPDGQAGLLNNAFTYLAPVPPPIVTAVTPSFAAVTGGQQVTIQGSGFQAGATVLFGTITSTAVNVVSPSAILATVPGAPGVGVVDVTVTNPDTQFGRLASSFTYFQPADLPNITVVSLAPNEGPPTGGTPVFISGAGFKVGVTVRFGATMATSVTYLGPSALLVTAPPNPLGPVAVTATNPDGANNTLANAFNYSNGVVFLPPPMRLPMLNERGYELSTLFDFDGDGDLDAFMGRRRVSCDSDGNDQLWVNSNGSFSVLATFPGDVGRTTVGALAMDIEGNGTRDLFVLSDDFTERASVYRNAPLGTFQRFDTPATSFTPAVSQIRGAAAGDLNTDGFPDVFVAGAGVDFMFMNQRDGGFVGTRAGLPTPSGAGINDDSRDVCIGDYDRDGDDDVFVVNASNQQSNYYLQGPAGVFTLSNALIPIVGGTGTGCVSGVFRNGSNIQDLVVVRDGQPYQYLRNDGTGRFTDEATIPIFRLPNPPPSVRIGFPTAIGMTKGVQAVDLDTDGDLDLVMNHVDLNPRIQTYLNDGFGNFTIGTASRIPPTLDSQEWTAIGDLNSDGRPDMLVPGEGTQPRLLFGGNNGVMTYSTMRTIPEQSYCVQDAIAADLDRDGDQDLFSVSGCKYGVYESLITDSEPVSCRTNTVHYWLNDGAGGFTDDTTNRFPAFGRNGTAVAVGDVDNDNDLDLLVGTSGVGTAGGSSRDDGVRLYLNNGSGVFTDNTYPRLPGDRFFATDIIFIDVNKDNALDIYVTGDTYSGCGSAGSHRLWLNTGNGFYFDVTGQLPYSRFPSLIGTCDNFQPRAVESADFNGDTYPDLYVVGNGRNRLLFNRGTIQPGFYTDVTNSNVPNVQSNSRGVATQDLNNDGYPDLFVCNIDTDRINLGNASGILSDVTPTNWPAESQPFRYSFSGCTSTPSPIESSSCSLGDVDGDGDQDIVLAGGDTSQFRFRNRLRLNTGSANFVDVTNASLPFDTAYTEKVLLFRANADTKPDLFVGNCGQPYVYLNAP